MFVKLTKTRKGEELIVEMEKIYRSINDLQLLVEKYPENETYQVDLNNWLYYLKNQNKFIQTQELIIFKDELGEN
jgi:hypothetical protein